MKLFLVSYFSKLLLIVIFFTSSLDRILKFNLGGFTIRFAYVIIFLLGTIIFLQIINNFGKIKIGNFPGFFYLFIWTLFLILFIPNTTFLTRNIGYMLWHIIHCLLIFFILLSVSKYEDFVNLFKTYIYSFIAFAVFGILQLLFGLFGISLFVSDWWLPHFPRVNGFTYEPSYFGTYLLIGWGIVFILKVFRNSLFEDKTTSIFFTIMTLSVIVTSSRMSFLILALVLLSYLVIIIIIALLKLKIQKKKLILVTMSVIMVFFISMIAISQLEKIKFLFAGIGLSGSSSHSVNQRSNESLETFHIFTRSPLIGVSLGGIPSARALKKGVIIQDNITAKNYEGLNIFLEMLAASGIIGFAFFLFYLLTLIWKSVSLHLKIKKENLNLSIILLSLVFSFICELAILSMNQNISRLYLWVHIGMLSVAIKIGIKYKNAAGFRYVK